MDKISARRTAKEAVKNMSARDRFAASDVICGKAFEYIKEKGVKSVFAYVSVSGEVSTFAFLSALIAEGVKVYIPKLSGDDMLLSELKNDTQFILNQFGIPESPAEGKEVYDADINIIPLVAFDKNCNRVGHGKGYYDRYLKKASGEIIAFAFASQEVEDVDCDEYDVKPSKIITEKGIIE